MIETLAEPDRRKLAKPPINLVILQLEFAPGLPWTQKGGLLWRDALKARGYNGKMVQVQYRQVALDMNSGVPQTQNTVLRNGHQIHWGDGQTAAVYENALIVETSQYSSWKEYLKGISPILEAVKEVRNPQVLLGFSLRYVNALSDEAAESPDFWIGKVSSAFLGPYADSNVRPTLTKGFSFYSLQVSDEVSGELRIGMQPDAVFAGRVAYVFDLEVTQREQEEYSIEHVLDVGSKMNTVALQLFQQILTPDYRESLVAAR